MFKRTVWCIFRTGGTPRALIRQLRHHPEVALILAFGELDQVTSVARATKPVLAVPVGNAPAWICADADFTSAATMVVQSTAFDNGLSCSAEQHLVVDRVVVEAFGAALAAQGAAVLTLEEAQHLVSQTIDPVIGRLRSALVGQDAQRIATTLGITRDYPLTALVVPLDRSALAGPFGRAKLAPLLSWFTAQDDTDGLTACQQLLANAGRGHTAIIHTRSRSRVEQFALAVPVSRILINTSGAQGSMGMGIGLTPSSVPGCGTFGGIATSDIICPTGLVYIKHVVSPMVLTSDQGNCM